MVYADDFALITLANTRTALENKVNNNMINFKDLCDTANLKISDSKTICTIFSKSFEKCFSIFKINNRRIAIKKSMKYLVVYIDSLLGFTTH